MTAIITLVLLGLVVWATCKVVARPKYRVEVLLDRGVMVYTVAACNPQEAEGTIAARYPEDTIVVAFDKEVA